ncbi:hypothetical protein JJJ17_18590 [Paracoccus caeni]|uniref:DUF1311 domain-containing protein n=1 Tax=Paracoccus caeni TaxID=657651 RepID=A0A934SFG8_9RHOB|nr:hypothetical protein [Paracoccus caeni]MBK4217941.1 hypothetical protein [Paracoccus caeni]
MTTSAARLLGTVALLCLGFPALADDARYFTSQRVVCDGRAHIIELKIAPADEPNLQMFWRDDKNRISGRDWHLPSQHLLGEPVLLEHVANYPKAVMAGLDGEAPTLTLTGFDHNPIPNCDAFALTPAATPEARYDAVQSMLDSGSTAPGDVAAARVAADDLPPPVLLPPLDRQTAPRAVQHGLQEMVQRMADEVQDLAGEIDGDAAAALLPGLRDYWLASRGSDDTKLLLRAQETRAVALMIAGRDVTGMAETDPARFCAVVDGVSTNTMSPNYVMIGEESLIEIASGLPLEHWTRDFAEASIALSKDCESDRYEAMLAQVWPRAEARIAGMEKLRTAIAELAAVPVTLEDYRAHDWLAFDPSGLRDSDLSPEDVRAITEPVIAKMRQDAIPVLAEELAARLDPSAELWQMQEHCLRETTLGSFASERAFHEALVRACHERVAPMLLVAGQNQIAADLARAEAAGDSFEDAVSAQGYAILPDYANLTTSAVFAPALTELGEARAAAEAQITQKRDRVLEAEATRLQEVFADLDPMDEDRALILTCRHYPADQAWLGDLRSACQEMSQRYQQDYRDEVCEALFDSGKAPDALRDGQIEISLGNSVPVREALCDPLIQMQLTRQGGLFSTKTYELSFRNPASDYVGAVSATLSETDSAGLWRISDITLSEGALRAGLDPNDARTLGLCLNEPLQCAN